MSRQHVETSTAEESAVVAAIAASLAMSHAAACSNSRRTGSTKVRRVWAEGRKEVTRTVNLQGHRDAATLFSRRAARSS